VDVVLVRPRNPLNIGAAARAMANFGFTRLTVVAPFAPTWREARSAAVGADDLLQNAKSTESLAEAVAECTLVAGTGTLTFREPEQRVVSLPALGPMVRRELERGGRVAGVFGPEKHGLTREDLSHCHLLVEIPTDAAQPSMNLGQAVAVCLYELGARGMVDRLNAAAVEDRGTPPIGQDCEPQVPFDRLRAAFRLAPLAQDDKMGHPAASGELDRLAGVVEETMTAAGYSPALMREANGHDLRLMLRRLGPTKQETQRILGLFRRILWRLRRVPNRD